MPPQILFAKKRANESRVHSIVVGETGFYWRELCNREELTAALEAEHYSLIIVDHRNSPENPLAYVETFQASQENTPVLVVSEPLSLEDVVKAIRLGVNDVFYPPIDLTAIVGRVYSILQPELGTVRGARLEEWAELTMQFADDESGASMKQKSGPPEDAPTDVSGRRVRRGEATAKTTTSRPDTHELAIGREKLRVAQEELARKEQALDEKTRELVAAQENLEVELLLVKETRAKLSKKEAENHSVQAMQTEITASREKLTAEQAALTEAREKLEREQAAWQEACAQAEAKFTHRERGLVEGEKKAKRLEKMEAQLEAGRLLASQEQSKLACELAALAEQANSLRSAREEFAAEQSRVAAELQKTTETLAGRERLLADGEKELARLKAELSTAAEKSEMEQQLKDQQAADLELERKELEAMKARLVAEEQAFTDQIRQTEAQLKTERMALDAEKAAFDQEAQDLIERMRAFETKQQQLKEQMKQMLTVSS